MNQPLDLTIRERETARCAAMRDGDTAALTELLAPDVTYLHSNGHPDTRADYLAKLSDGRLVYRRLTCEVLSVRALGPAAMVLSTMRASAEVNGEPRELDNRTVTIWEMRAGTWQLTYYQGTTVSPA
jgi:ketosteroid isomerase-like protein